MRLFFIVSCVYLAITFLLNFAIQGEALNIVVELAGMVINASRVIFDGGSPLLLIFTVAVAALFWRRIYDRRREFAYALGGGFLFQIAFLTTKSNMPFVQAVWTDPPFWADPSLAWLDWVIHFGNDPWILVFDTFGTAPLPLVDPVYVGFWGILTLFFLPVVSVLDVDQARVRRLIIAYCAAWIGLGNGMALVFMSAGPVFYDTFFPGGRFADLTATLEAAKLTDTTIVGDVQKILVAFWIGETDNARTGISAFPSMHVAMTALVGFYVTERSRWFLIPSVLLTAAILFYSVYTGFHYAIDGYVSIVLVWLLWRWLQRRAE